MLISGDPRDLRLNFLFLAYGIYLAKRRKAKEFLTADHADLR